MTTLVHPAPARIAHACGGFNNRIYNNCRDALLHNISLGYLWFEIDFVYVDDELVTDAGRAAEVTGDKSSSYYSAKDEGKASTATLDTTAMTLLDLAQIMKENVAIRIVVDNKDASRNMSSMKLLYNALPNASDRVLPQIFQPEEFAICSSLGFRHIIWTLYNYRGSDADVISNLKSMESGPLGGVAYVTMPQARAMTQLSKDVNKLSIPTLAHTINDQSEIDELFAEGVSEVYTDWCNAT